MADYLALLRHPEWQKKRLAVMEAAGFACCRCGTDDVTLNVHHRYYIKGRKPWEYPDEHLDCFCEDCHKEVHAKLEELKLLMGDLGYSHIDDHIAVCKTILIRSYEQRHSLKSTEEIDAVAKAYRLTFTEVADHLSASPDYMIDDKDLQAIACRRITTAAGLLAVVAKFRPSILRLAYATESVEQGVGRAMEGEELVFDLEPPADLLPLLRVLRTGIRAGLTGRTWLGVLMDESKPPRVLDITAPIPPGITLLSVEGDDRWDRIHPEARIKLPQLFASNLLKSDTPAGVLP